MAYIKKEDVIKAMNEAINDKTWSMNDKDVIEQMQEYVEALPTADVKEVKHGEWDWGTMPSGSVYAHCLSCNRKMKYSCYGYAYCPLCGAKMDGGKEE